jgi:hypothetical protein
MHEIHCVEAPAILAALKLESDRIHLANPRWGVLLKYDSTIVHTVRVVTEACPCISSTYPT